MIFLEMSGKWMIMNNLKKMFFGRQDWKIHLEKM